MARSDQFTVGIDFGTLSGRAVVVRVSDGAEVGSAVHDYAHGVLDTRLPASGTTLPPDWALQVPGDYRRGARGTPYLQRSRRPVSTRRMSSASRPTSPPARCSRCSLTERRCASCPEYADRPHAYVKLWKHHAAQAQADRINELAHARRESWIGRYGGLISSEWEFAKGLQLLEEDRELYDRDGPLRRSGRLDRLAALPVATSATPAPPATRASTRTAPTRPRSSCTALNPGFAGFVRGQARRTTSASSVTWRGGSPTRPRPGPGCRRASPSRSATSTPTSPRPPHVRPSPARWWPSWAPRPAT